MTLDAYSTRFLDALLSAFPEFRPHLKEGPEPGTLAIEFRSPSGSPFWIHAEEVGRITVGFELHHVHFRGWADSNEDLDFQSAIDFIRALMAGEYEVAVWTRDGEFVCSVMVAKGQDPKPWRDEEGLVLEVRRWSSES
jgi:hypothetical protein